MLAKNSDGFMGLPDGEIEAAAVLAGVPSICPADDEAPTRGRTRRICRQRRGRSGRGNQEKDRIVCLGGQRTRAE